ncbi:MAG: ATP phosphoribosyltransferase, partial [Clostridiales bacterium]|nr:ATP phosphoribosyltransferase [Clostridiales bacterium]
STLKANGLEIIDKVSDISTRLIANKVSLKYKSEEIYNLVDRFYDKIKKE